MAARGGGLARGSRRDARAPRAQAMELLAEGAADAPELPAEMKTAQMRTTFQKLGVMLRKMERL